MAISRREPVLGAAPTQRVDVIPDDRRTNLLNRISWGAVLAGVATSLVAQLLLNLLGIGIGLATVTAANPAENPNPGTFSIVAAVWWTVSGIIAAFLGALAAGRLCGAAYPNTARWHGLITWATTTLVVFYLLSSAIGGILGGAFSALGNTISGVGKTVANAAGPVAQAAGGNDALDAQVRSLVNPNDTQSLRDDVGRYIRASVTGNQQQANAAREQVVNGIAQTAGISPEEARGRLAQLEQQYRQTADQAKQQAQQAAETARKTAAQAGIFSVIALLLGAIAAWFGGGVGTPRRAMDYVTQPAE
jgi:hypothetical protein